MSHVSQQKVLNQIMVCAYIVGGWGGVHTRAPGSDLQSVFVLLSGDRQFWDTVHIVSRCELLSMPCLPLSSNKWPDIPNLQARPNSTPS